MKSKVLLPMQILIMILLTFTLSNEAWAKKKRRSRSAPTRQAENIEQGLCIQKNQSQLQAQGGKNSYCNLLRGIIDDPKSCAHQAISQLASSDSSIDGIGQFCSDYSALDSATDFYYQLLSAMAYTESGWKNSSSGDGGKSKGIFQISESDAANYSDCKGLNSKNIRDAYTNMKCGSCIAMTLLLKDREMGSGSVKKGNARGIARYFGPLSTGRIERVSISNATSQFCNGNAKDDMQYASLGGNGSGSNGGRAIASTGGGRVHMADASR
jgi:hypothetical protein